jgi:hypothetical protein
MLEYSLFSADHPLGPAMKRWLRDNAYCNGILRAGPRALYTFLLDHCHNGETGRCNPSVDYLTDMLGVREKTIWKWMDVLTYECLITSMKDRHSSGRPAPSRISFNMEPEPDHEYALREEYSILAPFVSSRTVYLAQVLRRRLAEDEKLQHTTNAFRRYYSPEKLLWSRPDDLLAVTDDHLAVYVRQIGVGVDLDDPNSIGFARDVFDNARRIVAAEIEMEQKRAEDDVMKTAVSFPAQLEEESTFVEEPWAMA